MYYFEGFTCVFTWYLYHEVGTIIIPFYRRGTWGTEAESTALKKNLLLRVKNLTGKEWDS